MESLWHSTVKIAERKPLPGDMAVDVAVIGAGMTGILTAYYLQKRGKHVIVLEAGRIAGGETGNTTAKITSQHGMCYQKLIRTLGKEKASLYARANEEAVKEYQNLIEQEKLACHFESVPSYLYSTVEEEALKREAKVAQILGIPAQYTRELELPMAVRGAVCFREQAQFHPLEFLKGLSEKVTIYENTRVNAVKEHVVYTQRGKVCAGEIVFATHYPITNIPGFYFVRQHQERSYVLALSHTPQLKGMYYSVDKDGISLRMADDVLLLGGGGHRTGKTTAGSGYGYLRQQAEQYYPGSREIARWSAQDCITHDQIPFIGRYSTLRPYWFLATGFRKWGMTSAMVAARLLTDQICEEHNPYEKLFSPQRHPFPNGLSKLFVDLGQSSAGLTKGYFHFPMATVKSVEKGEGKVVREGFRRYACYRDEQGAEHKISARCPHMGCQLEWNPEELTWDCPCHGSRFDCDGKLLDNPAQINRDEKAEKK